MRTMGAPTRVRVRVPHNVSNVLSAPSRAAVAEAPFVPSVPIFPPAWGAEVVSSNIVGYQKVTLASQFTLIGSQFLNVGTGVKDLQEFVTDSTMPGLDADNNYAFQTEIRLWDGYNYDTYGWDPDGDPNTPNSDHKWVDDYLNVIENVSMGVGTAAWIKVPASTEATLTVSGEVPEGTTTSVAIHSGFNLLSNPFPVATDIQSIQPSAEIPGLDAENNYAFQTEIRVWDGYNYDTYGWDPDGDPNVPNSDHKWVDDYLNVVNVTIPMGHGFWIKTTENGSVTFSK